LTVRASGNTARLLRTGTAELTEGIQQTSFLVLAVLGQLVRGDGLDQNLQFLPIRELMVSTLPQEHAIRHLQNKGLFAVRDRGQDGRTLGQEPGCGQKLPGVGLHLTGAELQSHNRGLPIPADDYIYLLYIRLVIDNGRDLDLALEGFLGYPLILH